MHLPIFNFDAPRRLPQQPNPNAVRAYIRSTLITRLDTTSEFAEEVAGKWHLGRSYDLYQIPYKNYIKIFGQDAGHVLYDTVNEDILEDWWNSYWGLLVSAFFAISVSIAACSLVCVFNASNTREMHYYLRYFFVAAGPMTSASSLQYPRATAFQGVTLWIGLACSFIGAWFGVIELCNSYVELRDKQS